MMNVYILINCIVWRVAVYKKNKRGLGERVLNNIKLLVGEMPVLGAFHRLNAGQEQITIHSVTSMRCTAIIIQVNRK